MKKGIFCTMQKIPFLFLVENITSYTLMACGTAALIISPEQGLGVMSFLISSAICYHTSSIIYQKNTRLSPQNTLKKPPCFDYRSTLSGLDAF